MEDHKTKNFKFKNTSIINHLYPESNVVVFQGESIVFLEEERELLQEELNSIKLILNTGWNTWKMLPFSKIESDFFKFLTDLERKEQKLKKELLVVNMKILDHIKRSDFLQNYNQDIHRNTNFSCEWQVLYGDNN